MKHIIFSTGNAEKFRTAEHVCKEHGISVTQRSMDIVEIQDEDSSKVALDKALKAYTATGQPTVITDDSWNIVELGGFPGPYMHSINEWLTPEDMLRLTLPLKDRRILLTQYLVYYDGQTQKIFCNNVEGTLLKKIRGTSKHASLTLIALPGDNGLSIAEVDALGANKSKRDTAQAWHDFAKWFNNQPSDSNEQY